MQIEHCLIAWMLIHQSVQALKKKIQTLVSTISAITLSCVWALYSFTKSITFWCDAWSPCDMLSRATFMPASARLQIISLVLVEGPMVHTIFVLRLTFGLDHTPLAAVASCWIALRCWKFSSTCQEEALLTVSFSWSIHKVPSKMSPC